MAGTSTDISNFSQNSGNFSSSSSFATESEMLAKLNDMRSSMDINNHDVIMEYKQQEYNLEMANLQKQFDYLTKAQKQKQKYEDTYEKKKAKQLAKLAKENKTADSADYKAWKAIEDKKYQKQLEHLNRVAAKQVEADKVSSSISNLKNINGTNNLLSVSKSILQSFSSAKKTGGLDSAISGLITGIADLAKQLDKQIDEIATYRSKLDTRLLGTGKKFEGRGGISQVVTGVAGLSPLVKQSQIMSKIDDLVGKGIAYDVEQRAFLDTIADKIATTFDAANGTLLQLVRVQQADTTAARLGEEAALNSFLNSMYSDTEYLKDVSSSVKSSLYEATAQLSATGGVGLEYQVQKWLGSLYSVGMSSSSVTSIANALGMLGSGNVSGLMNDSAMQNLLVMSASKAGLPYADLLTNGLNSENTNKLMESMVEYLAEIANSNKVVQSQYANVFGMSMSDITAAKNLTSSLQDIYKSNLDYNSALSELYSTASTMYSRTSLGEMMQNMWENTKYSMSAGIASNPALYAIWKAATLLEDAVGGIPISTISILGNSVDLETTVSNLMRVGALSGGILSSIGAMISAGGSGGFDPSSMLTAMGVSPTGVSTITRGTGAAVTTSGITISKSNYIGNSSSSDVSDYTTAEATDAKSSAMTSAKKENNSTTIDIVNNNVVKIYELFSSIIVGGSMKVSLADTIEGFNK